MNEAHSFISCADHREYAALHCLEELKDAVVARTVHRGRPDDCDRQQIGDGMYCFLGHELAAAVRSDRRGRGVLVNGLAVAGGTNRRERTYVYEPLYSITPFDHFGKYRFGSTMIDREIVVGPPSEGRTGNVIDEVDIGQRFVPVSRTIQAAVC